MQQQLPSLPARMAVEQGNGPVEIFHLLEVWAWTLFVRGDECARSAGQARALLGTL